MNEQQVAAPSKWQNEVFDLLRRGGVTQFAYVPDAGHHARRLRRGQPVAVHDGTGGRAGVAGRRRDLPARRNAGRGLGGSERFIDHGVPGGASGGGAVHPETARRQTLLRKPTMSSSANDNSGSDAP